VARSRSSGNALERLAVLERGARVLRRLGLSRVVDAVAARVGSRLLPFEIAVDGLFLTGDRIGELYYVRELVDSNPDKYFCELFVEAIRPGATVFEGGAYIGYLTMQAARAAGASGRVVSVEPDPRTARTLRANISRNGYAGTVEVVDGALGAETGRASFHMTEGGSTSSLHAPGHAAEATEVELVVGDDLVDEAAVVKLDVEGNEPAALRGMRRLIERSHPIIFCECNREMLSAAGSSPEELRLELERLGYAARWIDEEARELRSLDVPWEAPVVNWRCEPAPYASSPST
jgi:FkbM family methyltransferase